MRRFALPVVLFLLLLSAVRLAAQVGSTTDVIRGRVTDERGEPVAGASVQATSAETGTSRTATTAADGRYTIVFPDGGGRYTIRVARLGQAPRTSTVARVADEDVLTANVQLGTQAVQLQGVTARAQRPAPGRGETGQTGRSVSSELAQRLPLENQTDPAAIATLTPGVVATEGADSLSGRGGFSVAGQRASQNQVTLDGASFASALSGGQLGGGSPLGLPQEGVRSTQVITNTYDVARGQFSGGQVASTTRGGTNRVQGSLQTQFRGDALQGGTGRTPWNNGFAQLRGSGGVGGPLRKDKLFYNLSFAAQRRSDDLYALEPRNGEGLEQVGLSSGAVSEFLTGLSSVYGFNPAGLAGQYNRTVDALSLLGRFDWVMTQEHTFTLRGYGTLSSQDRTRIGTLETQQSGGSSDSHGGALLASVTSRFRQTWINDLRASYTIDSRDGSPTLTLPQGIVRVDADPLAVSAGARAVSNLVFGGDPSLFSQSDERTLEVADELSLLVGDRHRVKLGLLANHSGFSQSNASNRLGSFIFNSLADFQSRTPAAFTRTLSTGEIDGGGWNAGAYLGDAFRPTEGLQFTYGLRVEGSRFDRAPDANPAVATAFGVRTDYAPSEVHLSPRAGFSWRMNETGAPLRLLRGGFGEFRGRTPYELYSATLAGTGTGGEIEVSCVGSNVPIPDWSAYRNDPSSIPTTCTDGTLGGGAVPQQPNITVFQNGFQAPRSWRGSLGFQAQVLTRITASIDGTFARGVAQYGVRDLNLRDEPVFTLANEGNRPVFAPASAIVPATGQTSLYASRRDPDFARVYELSSDLASQTEQLTFSVNGLLPRLISAQASYTLTRSRDQTSFGFGGPSLGFQFTPTRGDPNQHEWAPSDQDRRHSFTLVLGKTFGRGLETSLIGRASSGQPYTPLVGGDVNGDGARNDAAFVFDPSTLADTAVAGGLSRVLGGSNRISSCLKSQTGRIAERNSCRGPWTESLDFRAAYTPQNTRLQHRVTVSLDAFNLPAGLDLLFHGGNDLHGWGQGGRPDNVLLYPTGFDPATHTFRYRVNEGFGQTRVFRTSSGSPFGMQLTARVALGRVQQGAGGGLLGIAFGGGGAPGGDRGDRGGGGFRGGGGERGQGGGTPDPSAFVDRLIPQPIDAIVLLKDTLHLSDEQVTRLQAVNDSLKARNAPIRGEVGQALAGAFQQAQQGAGNADPQAIFRRIGPRLNEGRQNVQKALDEAERILTPEQWRRVPAAVRNSVRQQLGAPR
jgi:hypothetical protein